MEEAKQDMIKDVYRCEPVPNGSHIVVPMKISIASMITVFVLIMTNVVISTTAFTRLQTQVEGMNERMTSLELRLSQERTDSTGLSGKVLAMEADIRNTRFAVQEIREDFKGLLKELRNGGK